ncbi:hypothetical protein C441_04559 [Haloferax sulfurifontis ATCC BAA-897]|uniref:Uncharacterized protein n=1 Tax=Haloferax sulfurifontis ATCC BAA-897 TaxID=662480 RepID=M0IIN3_9EURY|nr:hypothetical protein C441_04559 [Haloferax sulfurifontis ATCC BAA-897]
MANPANTVVVETTFDTVEYGGLTTEPAFAVDPTDLPLTAMMSDQTGDVTLRFDDGETEAKRIGGNLMGYIALEDPQFSQTWADVPDIDEWDGRAELAAADFKSAVGAVLGGSVGKVRLTIGDEALIPKSEDHGAGWVHDWPVQAHTRGERVSGTYDEDTLAGVVSCISPDAQVTIDMVSSHSSILRIQSDGGLTFWVAGQFNEEADE